MKNLIVCIDGTSNASEIAPGRKARPSNVLLLSRCLGTRDARNAAQIINYVRGIGTDHAARYAGRRLAHLMGTGLSQMVQDAYAFLTSNYELGDYIYILGFSRGAAAARSLSGLTELFGILPPAVMDLFPYAWDYYNTPPERRPRALDRLRATNAPLARIADTGERLRAAHDLECERYSDEPEGILREYFHAPSFGTNREGEPVRTEANEGRYVPLPLHFVGVWDTVFHADREGFHESRLAWNVGSAYQALAIHEVRDDFQPVLWHRKCRHQHVQQTWFRGSHSDVGGGYGTPALSSIALHWMIERIVGHPHVPVGHQLGFRPDMLARLPKANAAASLTYPQHDRPFKYLPWSARQMGGSWHGVDLQFRHKSAMPNPFSYAGADSERELTDAENNSKSLPLDK